jgi:outer membrane protein assembly factor BamE (lipoprotein component of BamABCDE complex)
MANLVAAASRRPKTSSRCGSILMMLMLCACTPLPIPIYIPGDNTKARMTLDESAVASIRPGVSTRESVLLALGEPGEVAPDARWITYAAQISDGEWRLVYGGIANYQILYGSGERVRYRTLLVFFDADSRVRDLWQYAGDCVIPCVELSPGRYWEKWLAYAKAQELIDPGEVVREGFISAAWRSNNRWMPGAAVVTSRALLFLKISDAGPMAYQQVLRVPAPEIASVESTEASTSGTDSFAVRITRTDGSGEEFAFKPLPSRAPYDAPPFERERAQHFMESVLTLGGRRIRK